MASHSLINKVRRYVMFIHEYDNFSCRLDSTLEDTWGRNSKVGPACENGPRTPGLIFLGLKLSALSRGAADSHPFHAPSIHMQGKRGKRLPLAEMSVLRRLPPESADANFILSCTEVYALFSTRRSICPGASPDRLFSGAWPLDRQE